RQLTEHPELMETAVDEFLRYEPPIHGFARSVARDCSVGAQQLRAGETVFMLWASANRDPAEFPEPDEVNLARFPNRHLTFGVGAHRCLGSTLARVEFRIVLEEVLARLPDYRILEDEIENPQTIAASYGRVRIPAVFTPGH